MSNQSSVYTTVFKLQIACRGMQSLVEIKSLMGKYIHFVMKTQQDVENFKITVKDLATEDHPVEITTDRGYWKSHYHGVKHITHSQQELSDLLFSNLNIRATETVIGKYLYVIVKNKEGEKNVLEMFPDLTFDGHPIVTHIDYRPTLFGTYKTMNWKSYGYTEDGMIACDLCEGKKKVAHLDGCPGCGSTGYLFDCLKHNAETEHYNRKRYTADFNYMVDFVKKTSTCKTCKGDSHKTFGGCPCVECGLIGTQPWGG